MRIGGWQHPWRRRMPRLSQQMVSFTNCHFQGKATHHHLRRAIPHPLKPLCICPCLLRQLCSWSSVNVLGLSSALWRPCRHHFNEPYADELLSPKLPATTLSQPAMQPRQPPPQQVQQLTQPMHHLPAWSVSSRCTIPRVLVMPHTPRLGQTALPSCAKCMNSWLRPMHWTASQHAKTSGNNAAAFPLRSSGSQTCCLNASRYYENSW
mmetsp:Transcript_46411/g.92086  ORF Transcript_46411/g.92086 Transcript_46411/m.92086 type:complete len:208 (-) Transcript_46411:289-912(-)